MNLLACPERTLVHCLTFLTDFSDRNHLPAISRSFVDYSHTALEEAVAELFEAFGGKFSTTLIDCGRSAGQIEMRVEKILVSRLRKDKQTLLSQPNGHLIYKWYEAQVRLQLFAGHHSYRGASGAEIANLCLRNMSRADLNLQDPRVLGVFSVFLGVTTEALYVPVMPRLFADVVVTRDMGSEDLGFSFREVLQTIVCLAVLAA